VRLRTKGRRAKARPGLQELRKRRHDDFFASGRRIACKLATPGYEPTGALPSVHEVQVDCNEAGALAVAF
jgi:hypothetical protein